MFIWHEAEVELINSRAAQILNFQRICGECCAHGTAFLQGDSQNFFLSDSIRCLPLYCTCNHSTATVSVHMGQYGNRGITLCSHADGTSDLCRIVINTGHFAEYSWSSALQGDASGGGQGEKTVRVDHGIMGGL